MKKFLVTFLLISVCSLYAQEDKAQMDENMKAWTEYMTPGEMHKMLAENSGEWKTSTKAWMAPDTEPMLSEGSVKAEMLMGGRYLKMEHSGTSMGMPFNGISIEGYDNVKKKFVNIWIDDMGTGIARSEGTYDADNKTITYNGVMSDPMSKGDIKFKSVLEIVDKDKSIFTMYMNYEGKEMKWMEMTYTRVK